MLINLSSLTFILKTLSFFFKMFVRGELVSCVVRFLSDWHVNIVFHRETWVTITSWLSPTCPVPGSNVSRWTSKRRNLVTGYTVYLALSKPDSFKTRPHFWRNIFCLIKRTIQLTSSSSYTHLVNVLAWCHLFTNAFLWQGWLSACLKFFVRCTLI